MRDDDGRRRDEVYRTLDTHPAVTLGRGKVTARFTVTLNDGQQLPVVRVRYGADHVRYYERALFERTHVREDAP